jgi:hypothetical protein
MEFEQFLQSRAKRMESELKILAGLEKQDNVNSLLTPETPFSNNSYFRNILFSCRGFIYWMDKYFSKRGLDYLIDFIDPKQIKEIKIIMSLESFTPVFKEAFIDFREEMTNKNVSIQLKIINKSNLKSRLHDRFIISKDDAFNIPSPDVLARGQLSEISKSNNRTKILKEFDDLWDGCEDCFPDENKE